MKYFWIAIGFLALASCTNQNGLGYEGSNSKIGMGPVDVSSPQTVAPPPTITPIIEDQGPTWNSVATSTGDTVLFEMDQSFLTPQAKSILDAQANWFQTSNRNILIEGHADEKGTREYNLALGGKRAASVRDYLISKGIAAYRIDVITYGKERPLEVCSEESCWAKNRRAVTVVQ